MPASVQSAFNSLISSGLAAAAVGSHAYQRSATGQARAEVAQAKKAVKTLNKMQSSGKLNETQRRVAESLATKAQSNLEAAVAKKPSTRTISKLDEVRKAKESQEVQFRGERAEEAVAEAKAQEAEEAAAYYAEHPEEVPEGSTYGPDDPYGTAALESLVSRTSTKQNQREARKKREETLKRG